MGCFHHPDREALKNNCSGCSFNFIREGGSGRFKRGRANSLVVLIRVDSIYN